MNIDTRKIGDIAEYKFITFCLQNNIEVCKPINSGLQYDLLIKINGIFKRVQVKSRCLVNGAIRDITRYKLQVNRKKPLIDYTENSIIDLLIVYCPETGSFYDIPLEELKKIRTMTLRVKSSKNNQTHGVRLAKNYELNFS
jgi:hypothetical protein